MKRFATVIALVLATSAFAERLPIAPDESLPVMAYIEAGAPASDREWTSADYEKLAAALTKIAEKNARQLPRFDSPKSGALMQRIVSPANFGSIRDRQLTLAVRLTEAGAITQRIGAVVMLYATATNEGEAFDRELVELMSFIARVTVETWATVDELLATLTPEERAARAAGLDTVRAGSAQIISGAIQTFGETDVYRPAELVRLANALRETLPSLFHRLSDESAAELLVQLRNAAENATDKNVAAALRQLLEATEAKKN
jgi:hypothetical protein